MATRALKISGNKGVDAALETIQKLGHQEGRNGFARAATTGQVIHITTLINTTYSNFMRFDFYSGFFWGVFCSFLCSFQVFKPTLLKSQENQVSKKNMERVVLYIQKTQVFVQRVLIWVGLRITVWEAIP